MSALARQQQAILQALWQPRTADAMETMAPHVQGTPATAPKGFKRGLQAYRSNAGMLAERVLAAAYPVVAESLGEENFAPLARRFWAQQPPQRGDLAQWGESLAAWLSTIPALVEDQPFLPDVARLEWALHGAATAADLQPDLASFALLGQHEPATLTLALAAGFACIRSAGPLVVLAGIEGVEADEAAGPQSALVWRQGLQPRCRPAPPQECDFLQALQRGLTLAAALDAAPGLEFESWLLPAVQEGLVLGALRIDPQSITERPP